MSGREEEGGTQGVEGLAQMQQCVHVLMQGVATDRLSCAHQNLICRCEDGVGRGRASRAVAYLLVFCFVLPHGQPPEHVYLRLPAFLSAGRSQRPPPLAIAPLTSHRLQEM